MKSMDACKRILVVDDEIISRAMLESHLLSRGYDVITAASGEDALAGLAKQPVSLVISDLVMPGMDGIQLMQAAKAHYPNLPFIVFTGAGSIESAVTAIKQGALDYLEKPFHPETFDVVLLRALEFGRLADENVQLRERIEDIPLLVDFFSQSLP
jgi:DNA-binding NtrC family response regulator